MLTRITRALRRRDDDRGAALVAVIGIGAVLMVVLSLVVATATSGATKAAHDDDYNKAMAAAYAGLADYQGRLAADNSYVKYAVRSTWAMAGTFTTPPLSDNKAFATSGPSWAAVVGSADQSYRYEVDNSDYATTGKVRLRVTGRSGDVTRSLLVDLRGDGFVNYLYFTDYESQDPSLTGAGCTSWHRNERGWSTDACEPVSFARGDLLDGPVRTNDVITACGATFASTVQHAGRDGFFYTDKTTNIDPGCKTATTFTAGPVQQVGTLPMPATNANLKQEVRYDVPAKVVTPGCLYTGPTSITFLPGGRMTVVSPWTKYTQMEGDAAGNLTKGRNNEALCGSVSALRGAGATIPTLPANLVYVQSVPNVSTDWNYTAPGQTPSGAENSSIAASAPVYCQQRVRTGTNTTEQRYGNGLGYPRAGEFTGAYGTAGYYGCRNGDVFVRGSFGGQMTVAAENFVYVTGSTTYANGTDSDDMLGLVGQKAVSVLNPISCSAYVANSNDTKCQTSQGSSRNLAPSRDVEIDAAIASNRGTFNVQNSAFGADLGKLTVFGSIAQEFRGSVRTQYTVGNTSSWVTGYAKAYSYDQRLKAAAPPKFLQPVSTTYGVTTETETATAFTADGARTGK